SVTGLKPASHTPPQPGPKFQPLACPRLGLFGSMSGSCLGHLVLFKYLWGILIRVFYLGPVSRLGSAWFLVFVLS
uniref:Uncharacterized protein n=1 Tax=Cannabis sativa TaxID=3483 RepID=A0A803QRV6_CANSA